MAQSIAKDAARATVDTGWDRTVDRSREGTAAMVDGCWDRIRGPLIDLMHPLRIGAITPALVLVGEKTLWVLLLSFGRELLDALFNARGADSPRHILHEGMRFRREHKPTCNRHVATLFGTITVLRHGYRCMERGLVEQLVFPLELELGLTQGATPALTELIAGMMAEAGASQGRVLAALKERHHVHMGAERLRKIVATLAEELAPFGRGALVARLVAALEDVARQGARPVLSVGRDGITLREYRHRFFQVATAATLCVLNPKTGRRTTTYLAFPPELGQAEMSRELKATIDELLRSWTAPIRLAYVADSGDNESGFFQGVLRRMRHPRTGERLDWTRVVDFYHASERVWAMARTLFGNSEEAGQWASRMLSLMKRSKNGARRVLASAAKLHSQRKLSTASEREYRKARNYLRIRLRWMRYWDYRRLSIPLGSGVTEAACKIIFTQRLKLSGQRWTKQGARQILVLRTHLLSRILDKTFLAALSERPLPKTPTHDQLATPTPQIAA